MKTALTIGSEYIQFYFHDIGVFRSALGGSHSERDSKRFRDPTEKFEPTMFRFLDTHLNFNLLTLSSVYQLYLSRWLSLLQEVRGEPLSVADNLHGCTRYHVFALCHNIEARMIDMGWQKDAYGIDVHTKLTNIVLITTSDQRSYFNGSIGFMSIRDASGITVAVPEITSRQFGVTRPAPCFGLDVKGKFTMNLEEMVGRCPLPFLNTTHWSIRTVYFTFDGRLGFTDCNEHMVYFTDQMTSGDCVSNTAAWLTSKPAHANRLAAERFIMNPNQDLPGIIIGADDQTVHKTNNENSNLFTNAQLQDSQGWAPWFESRVNMINVKGTSRYESLRDWLRKLTTLREVNEWCTFARHPYCLNDRFRDLVVKAVSGGFGLDTERWGTDTQDYDTILPSSDSKRANALKRDIVPGSFYGANSSNFIFPAGGNPEFLWAAELAALPEAEPIHPDSNRHQFSLNAQTMHDRVHHVCPALYPDECGVDWASLIGTLPLGTFADRWKEDLKLPRLDKIAHPRDPIGCTVGNNVVLSQFVHNEATPLFMGPLVDVNSCYYGCVSLACGLETSVSASLGRICLTCGTPRSPITRKIASFGGCQSRCPLLVIETGNSLFKLEFRTEKGEKRGRNNSSHNFPTWVMIDKEQVLMDESHTYAHIHTYLHTYRHTYIHVYIYICTCETSNPPVSYRDKHCAFPVLGLLPGMRFRIQLKTFNA